MSEMSRRTAGKILLLGASSILVPRFVTAASNIETSQYASLAVMNPLSGNVLVERDPSYKRPMASLTKIMTGLVVFDAMQSKGYDFGLKSLVTIPQEVENIHPLLTAMRPEKDGTGLRVGDTVEAGKLLIAMGARSDAYSSVALAIHTADLVAGNSEELEQDKLDKFVRWMNLKAQNIGMENTNFKNVTGENEEGHYSTAADIARLVAHVQKIHPDLVNHAFGQREFDLAPFSKEITHSSGFMRWHENDAVWAKTGYVRHAGHCLATYFEQSGKPLVGVVMAEEDSYKRNAVMSNALRQGYLRLKRDVTAELNR